jgi:hypothetical protein
MVERPRASASGTSRPAPKAPAPDAARHSTARVATTQGARSSELPGWFWTALGCMTVLVVGLTVVFFVFQSSAAPTAPGESAPAPLPAAATTTVVPSAPTQAADTPRPAVQGIRVERMAPAAPAIDQVAAPVAKTRAAARPVKVARTPAAKPAAAPAAKPASAESEGEANEEELLKPRQRPAATAQDEESEEK